ncbi:MAG: glutathione S-transferase [Rhodovulum sulfidophilum]|uniref:Glutathione S-transferase n=1 Tax=Rhodovulum sulfidophilum TaxID=35806 RepID=A0A2W5N447_RHOSU|nr:MAG: glutathione S-transferase [Rhodovulum sulfidophilum]
MKILHGKLSPYVRKVMICVHEKGLPVEIEPAAVGQGKINAELLRLNPSGKIPTLVLDDGAAVFDSLVICDYLDELEASPRVIPATHPERRAALTLNATADALVTAGVLATIERGKAAEKRWPDYEAAQWAKVDHCLAALEAALPRRGEVFDIGAIAAVCALGWMDARAGQRDWRGTHPQLAKWADARNARASVAATRPLQS